jgi:hypothetical protein
MADLNVFFKKLRVKIYCAKERHPVKTNNVISYRLMENHTIVPVFLYVSHAFLFIRITILWFYGCFHFELKKTVLRTV